MNDLRNIDSDLSTTLSDENLTNILLYGYQIYDNKTNQIVLLLLLLLLLSSLLLYQYISAKTSSYIYKYIYIIYIKLNNTT